MTAFVISSLDSSFPKYHPKNPTFDDDDEVEKDRERRDPLKLESFMRGWKRVKSPSLARKRSSVEAFAMEERMASGGESKEAAFA